LSPIYHSTVTGQSYAGGQWIEWPVAGLWKTNDHGALMFWRGGKQQMSYDNPFTLEAGNLVNRNPKYPPMDHSVPVGWLLVAVLVVAVLAVVGYRVAAR
jgi:hypothetical protein